MNGGDGTSGDGICFTRNLVVLIDVIGNLVVHQLAGVTNSHGMGAAMLKFPTFSLVFHHSKLGFKSSFVSISGG